MLSVCNDTNCSVICHFTFTEVNWRITWKLPTTRTVSTNASFVMRSFHHPPSWPNISWPIQRLAHRASVYTVRPHWTMWRHSRRTCPSIAAAIHRHNAFVVGKRSRPNTKSVCMPSKSITTPHQTSHMHLRWRILITCIPFTNHTDSTQNHRKATNLPAPFVWPRCRPTLMRKSARNATKSTISTRDIPHMQSLRQRLLLLPLCHLHRWTRHRPSPPKLLSNSIATFVTNRCRVASSWRNISLSTRSRAAMIVATHVTYARRCSHRPADCVSTWPIMDQIRGRTTAAIVRLSSSSAPNWRITPLSMKRA